MNNGKAFAIFKNINSDKYTYYEKIEAIEIVLTAATTNSITKSEFKAAFIWLWNWLINESELISRQAVLALLKEWADSYSYIEIPTEDALKKISDLPTIKEA